MRGADEGSGSGDGGWPVAQDAAGDMGASARASGSGSAGRRSSIRKTMIAGVKGMLRGRSLSRGGNNTPSSKQKGDIEASVNAEVGSEGLSTPPPLLVHTGQLAVHDNTQHQSMEFDEPVHVVVSDGDLGLDGDEDGSAPPSPFTPSNSPTHASSPAPSPTAKRKAEAQGTGLATDSFKARRKMDDDRGRVIDEMVSTEQSFCDFLGILKTVYRDRLAKELQPAEHKLLFGSIDQLLGFSETLLAELRATAAQGPARACVGPVYCKLSPFFRMYKAYASTHCQMAEVVEENHRRRAAFRRVCDECKNGPDSQGQSLQSLLIMPIQRVPRHLLLLKELRKHTEDAHLDAASLNRALSALGEIAQSMNQEIGDTENSIKILEIQRSMVPRPELFRTGRVFVRQGQLRKRAKDGMMQDLMFFLFSDCLVYAKPIRQTMGGAKYQFRRMVHVSRVSLIESALRSRQQDTEEDEQGPRSIKFGPGDLLPEEAGPEACDGASSFSASSTGSSRSYTPAASVASAVSSSPSAAAPAPPQSSVRARMASTVPGAKMEYFPFQVHATKSLTLFASSEEERQSWMTDLELHADPNVVTDLELAEKAREEERARILHAAQEKIKDVRVSDPVRVYQASAWFKLNEPNKKVAFAEAPEVHIKFQVSKTGSDLCVPGPVGPLAVLSLSLTVLMVRNISDQYIPAAADKPFGGIYCVISFGKQVHRTKLYMQQDDPTWMEEFRNMEFVASFFSSVSVKIKQCMHAKPRARDPCLATVDIKFQDVLSFTGIEVQDPDNHCAGLLRGAQARPVQRKLARMKQAKGFQISSSTLTDDYKKNQIRPQTERLPLSCKPLPAAPRPAGDAPPRPAPPRPPRPTKDSSRRFELLSSRPLPPPPQRRVDSAAEAS